MSLPSRVDADLTGHPVYRLRHPDPLGFENVARTGRALGATATHMAAVQRGAAAAELVIVFDVDARVMAEAGDVIDHWLEDAPDQFGMRVRCLSHDRPEAAMVVAAGSCAQRLRPHAHGGVADSRDAAALQEQLASALERYDRRRDASATARLAVRAVELGALDFALLASDQLLELEPDAERTTVMRLLTLNAACLHEAAEVRGRDSVTRLGENPQVMLHLARAVAHQDRAALAYSIADRIINLAGRFPGRVTPVTIAEADALRRRYRSPT